jgi:dTDP-4-amino-4,6-dideoxygalactose transaminase
MIRLARPLFDDRDLTRLQDVLTTGQLIQGPWVEAFEAAVADWLGGTHQVIACQSGTAALHLAMLALGLQPGDEVIVPAFTWPTTAHAVVHAGGIPVFVDVDADSLCWDPEAVRRAMSPRTRALLPVHLFGCAAPLDEALALVDAAPRPCIVEDAACALGTTAPGRAGQAGTWGAIGCFSLHPRKIITTGEGGLLTTADPAIADRLRALRNHGLRSGPQGLTFTDMGLNLRMPALSGALGVGQMERLPQILQSRAHLAACWLNALHDQPGIRIPTSMRAAGTVHQSFVVELLAPRGDDTPLPVLRQQLIERLRAAGMETTFGTWDVPSQPVWQTVRHRVAGGHGTSLRLFEGLLALPLHPAMNDADVAQGASLLRAHWPPPGSPDA